VAGGFEPSAGGRFVLGCGRPWLGCAGFGGVAGRVGVDGFVPFAGGGFVLGGFGLPCAGGFGLPCEGGLVPLGGLGVGLAIG